MKRPASRLLLLFNKTEINVMVMALKEPRVEMLEK